MLRHNYIYKFKNKNPFDIEHRIAQDEDNYILKNYRPLSEKTISSLPQEYLETFVDEILTNKKVSSVLYSTAAKSEINLLLKSKEYFENNSVKWKNKKTSNNNPSDIVLNRKKKETIQSIKNEADKFKFDKSKQLEILNEKNGEFHRKLRSDRQYEIKKYTEHMNIGRIERFELIFRKIKDKLENYYENKKKERNGIIFNDTKIILKHLELPDLKLNLNDVYSRLYHNAVFISHKTKTGQVEQLDTEMSKTLAKTGQLRNKQPNLRVKNVIGSTNGKEFTIKITDEIFMKCFSKHSGGPTIKIEGTKIYPHLSNKDQEYYINLLEMRDCNGNYLIHISVIDKFVELVLYLIIKNINLNVQNNDGDTPMHLSVRSENYEVK